MLPLLLLRRPRLLRLQDLFLWSDLIEDDERPALARGDVIGLVPDHLVEVHGVARVHGVEHLFHVGHVRLDLRVVPHRDAAPVEGLRRGQAHDDAPLDADTIDVQRQAAVGRVWQIARHKGMHPLKIELVAVVLPVPPAVLRNEDLVRLLEQRHERLQHRRILRWLRVRLLEALGVAADLPVRVIHSAEDVRVEGCLYLLEDVIHALAREDRLVHGVPRQLDTLEESPDGVRARGARVQLGVLLNFLALVHRLHQRLRLREHDGRRHTELLIPLIIKQVVNIARPVRQQVVRLHLVARRHDRPIQRLEAAPVRTHARIHLEDLHLDGRLHRNRCCRRRLGGIRRERRHGPGKPATRRR
mmetsp:Transcript_22356/g.69060  ORF Transcript_22356/g.69060 Transcript_22356/m.69060 type:complete len:358 (-) Transcript_22356:126-1199(-)